MAKDWHNSEVSDVMKRLGVGKDGLSDDEVRVRVKQYGKNKLVAKKPTSFLILLARQFKSPLMLVLIFAAAASIAVGEGGDAIVIFLAIGVNTFVGFLQEWKAERAAEALQSYENPRAMVRRDGEVVDIDARNVVPGDIVLLAAGSRVVADVRLVESIDLLVDEALLTGESLPVAKKIVPLKDSFSLGDRVNMAFLGTMVVGGRGEGVVVATGKNTELGDIVQLVTETRDEVTPLQGQLKHFSLQLGFLFLVVVVAMFGVGLLRGVPIYDMVAIAIALAVASIPEGLIVALTVVLAIGMQRMLKLNALTRRLVAAETLGSVSIVCTDKTGTLTRGVMSVVQVVTPKHNLEMHSTLPDDVEEMLLLGALNNDAHISKDRRLGYPTELALIDAAIEVGIDVGSVRKSMARIGEVPFTSASKFMITTHRRDGEDLLVVKGAPERVLEMCEMDEGARQQAWETAERMMQQGLRVLAIATDSGSSFDLDEPVQGARYVGLVGLKDPLRESVKGTVKQLVSAGIRLVLITGDHPDTAKSIATNAGIDVGDHGIVTGKDLDDMSDGELQSRIALISVFARVNPRHKVRIVQAWKGRDEVVAMVGDGVNDAAAMKVADIGVALGSGTDVAQQTSDMVLLDNNLSTIVSAVREGRIIFDNIRKVIVYLLADSFSEIILIGGAIALGLPLPLLAVQILWINLVTDGFPHLALTMEPGEGDVMSYPPRKKSEPVVSGEMKMLIFLIGIVTDIGLLLLFWVLIGREYDIAHLRTIMFSALAIDSLFYVYAVKSLRHSIFRTKLFQNKWLNIAVVAGILLQLSAIYAPPLQELFSTVSLQFYDWIILIVLSLIKLVVIEVSKEGVMLFKRKRYVASN
ncbi:HAD-IC family P-type ATPase [Candidatus Uhrbacteria bacterium]|jgi:P-type Ca2+ transporter type 2C|nr:HAD-IC family P-type ATPase [Candidatus Uhrbacteria bacterium]